MNPEPACATAIIHYFVDEAGDPTLFNRNGRLIVGDEGCSRYFLLGKLEIEEPEVLSAQLTALRQDLVADPYFKGVPSMQPGHRKTALAFHAKDDIPEVRREVYLWALQRFYERGEERFLDLIWPQVGEIHDLDRLENGRRGVFYTKHKPLDLAAFEGTKGPGI
jgi:hypothetical protein